MEHLIIGMGQGVGSTTKVRSVIHAVGSAGGVELPNWVKRATSRFAQIETRASVLIFHNHPPHPIRRLLDNAPLASDTDPRLMLAFQLLSLGLGRVPLLYRRE